MPWLQHASDGRSEYRAVRRQPSRSRQATDIAVRLSDALSPTKAACPWHQGPLPQLYRPYLGDINRQGAERRTLGSRDQVRWLPGPSPSQGRRRQGVHPARQRLDQPFPKDRDRRVAHQCRIGDYPWRGGGPGSGRHHGFLRVADELKGRSKKIVMVAFDLLYLNSYDLRKAPLFERKALSNKIIAETDIQFSESFDVDGAEMYKHACKTGLEGGVSKVRDSRYVSGRINDWVKKTCAQRETLAIAGFALDGKKWDGIYLARRKGKELIYAGKVDHGFDSASAKDLQARLKPLICETQPYSKKSPIGESGSNHRCWRRSNTGRSQPRGRYVILSSRASGRTYELGQGRQASAR